MIKLQRNTDFGTVQWTRAEPVGKEEKKGGASVTPEASNANIPVWTSGPERA